MNYESRSPEMAGTDRAGGTGLYIDVENVEAIAKRLISSLMRNWPDQKAPPPCRLVLYVRADSTELWDVWATHAFTDISVVVRGVQHYVKTGSKNSSDIAIAVDAMADLLLGRISHIAVLSDDTDFMSLYAVIRRECGVSGSGDELPFLWLVTDRSSTRSTTVLEFFPEILMHVVHLPDDTVAEVQGGTDAKEKTSKPANVYSEIAVAIQHAFTPGTYSSAAFQPLIQRQWPDHPMAKSNGAAYGTDFKNNVWPYLQKAGAKMVSQKPNKYQLP